MQSKIEPHTLLASDLDGTLIPVTDAPEQEVALRNFTKEVGRSEGLRLAYVTGRHLELAESAIEEFELPVPDFLVCDVGTSLYEPDPGSGGFVLDPVYAEEMRSRIAGADAGDIRRRLGGTCGLVPQPPERQTDFKASFEFEPGERERLLAEIREHLDSDAVSIVWSVDTAGGRGLLDLLPAGAGKDTALHHLHDRLKLTADRLFFAGDSGNDRAAMLSGYRVTVVANAPPELKAVLRSEARERDILDHLYFAESPAAAGVMEGARHWRIFE